jgi:indole-3-glycerol phosphate synthase
LKGTILENIIERKRERVADLKRSFAVADLRRGASEFRRDRPALRLSRTLSNHSKINVIAEFKRASPSKGTINGGIRAGDAAAAYAAGGAAAISVLTEEDFFLGSLDDLKTVRSKVDLPVLRKDFIFDEAQVFESAIVGADAFLLIVAALTLGQLKALQAAAHSLGLDAVVEVHDLPELKVAIDAGAKMIGVNNRDLKTFQVSLDVSRELIAHKPKHAIMIAESGITTREEIVELRSLGFDGFLIGETLMRSGDPGSTLRDLVMSPSAQVVRS